MNVTKSNLLGALNRYLAAYEGMGVPLEIRFQEGSKTQGVAYRIEMRDGSEAPGTTNGGFIGFTRSEAWHTLTSISRALEDLSALQKEQAEKVEAVYFKNDDGSVVGFEV